MRIVFDNYYPEMERKKKTRITDSIIIIQIMPEYTLRILRQYGIKIDTHNLFRF